MTISGRRPEELSSTSPGTSTPSGPRSEVYEVAEVAEIPLGGHAARVRLFETGHNRKTDALDAHSIAMVAVRTTSLRVLQVDGELEALRILTDRREALTRWRVQTVDRLKALLVELLPGQAKAMLAGVRPRDIAAPTRRRIAAEELAEPVAVEAEIKKSTAELKAIVLARGSPLMDLHGVSPVMAARVLADVGDVTRFADRNRFASWTGTAPLDASSGERNHHRLSRAGNRRMNHMIHIAAVTQLRLDTDGPAYYRRKRTEGKKPQEACAVSSAGSPTRSIDTSTAIHSRSPSWSPPDASPAPSPHRSPPLPHDRRSMRWFEASPRRATSKGQAFISCTAPPSPTITYSSRPPRLVAHQVLTIALSESTPSLRRCVVVVLAERRAVPPRGVIPRGGTARHGTAGTIVPRWSGVSVRRRTPRGCRPWPGHGRSCTRWSGR